jgi:ABC-type nitrate/sulfonate/bicarbonate transport system substrate-binding protein
MSRARVEILRRRDPLRVGFLPVSDCAPVVYAYEAGLFAKYGLEVELQRETSWANIRDKVVYGELDAAHAPATLPFLSNIGLESDPCACVSAMVLSLEGNAITISRQLWDQGVHSADSLRAHIYKYWRKRTFTFGVVCSFSSQEFLLRRWFKSAGIIPEVEIRIVAIPPAQMFPTLKLGYIDGYCVGEPWNAVAVQADVGFCVATSAELAPLHPEKVLMVRQSFAAGRAEEHERLLAALLEACAFCDRLQNRSLLAEMLAHPQYVNAPAECVGAGLVGGLERNGHKVLDSVGRAIFNRDNANDPSDERSRWIIDRLYGLLTQSEFKARNPGRTPVLKNVFRRDIFERAKAAMLDQLACDSSEAQVFEAGLAAKV